MTVDARTAQVDALFTRWAKSDSPGCSVAVMQAGEILYQQGYGMANLEYRIPNRPETIFHVASVSKQFAAAAMLLLESDGKLSLDDEVRKYLPQLHDFGVPIRIHHLIHHTSGLRDQWELLIAAGWRMDDVITLDDILGLVYAQRELNFAPGSEYTYCNTGYTLLGEIVRAVTGKTLREFCEERIFQPLGMTSTHFHDNYLEVVPNRAYSYSDMPGGFQHAHLMYSNVGATSLFTTTPDLLKWAQNYLSPSVIGADWTARMTRRAVLNDGLEIAYATGVLSRDYRGLPIIEHSGGDAGYRTHLMIFPGQQFAVAVFANLGSIATAKLATDIADIYLADALSTLPTQVVTLPPTQVQARAGLYYQSETGESLNLDYNAEQQALTLWGFPLEALSEDRFRLIAAPQLVLRFDASALELNSGIGRPVVYQRVETAAPSPDALAAFTGTYYSPELDVRYVIEMAGEGLALRRRKYGSRALVPTADDAFRDKDFGVDLRFTRGAGGHVTGLSVTTGRVRGLRFQREA
jgi:CubicO group peptidase (beta-lactamase class C family)